MVIALVFTPFVTPSYIPLGIAQLKSYIEHNLPSVTVRAIDLNNAFLCNLMDDEYLRAFVKLCRVCPNECKKQGAEKRNFLDRAKAFGAYVDAVQSNESPVFTDAPVYNRVLYETMNFWTCRQKCIDTVAKEIISKERPVRPDFEAIFKYDIRAIARLRPSVVGFSIFCSQQLSYSLMLAKIIKEKLNIPVIFGGAYMSHVNCREFMAFFSWIDFVFGREGEIGLVEFAKNFRKRTFERVPGLYYRRGRDIAWNSEQYIADLDSLPPADFGDFSFTRYLLPEPVIPLVFSRGCYWKRCAFCSYYKNHPVAYKKKSVDAFVAEIGHYVSFGVRHFFIVDDIISPGDLNAISAALRRKRMRICYGAIVRPEKNFTASVVRNMYAGGGRVLIWGVESSCQRVLDLIGKGTTIGQIKTVLKRASRAGFHNHLFMIEGFPTQTEEEVCRDLQFLYRNPGFIQGWSMHRFSLLKDSYIYHHPGKFNVSGIRMLPLYVRQKDSSMLYGEDCVFNRHPVLEWKRVRSREEALRRKLKDTDIRKFDTAEHAHMLLFKVRQDERRKNRRPRSGIRSR